MLTLDEIQNAVFKLATKYDVTKVDLFGSYASNSATADSDVDFLVEFTKPVPSIFAVMGFREELSLALGTSVDIVTVPVAKPELLNISEVKNVYSRT